MLIQNIDRTGSSAGYLCVIAWYCPHLRYHTLTSILCCKSDKWIFSSDSRILHRNFYPATTGSYTICDHFCPLPLINHLCGDSGLSPTVFFFLLKNTMPQVQLTAAFLLLLTYQIVVLTSVVKILLQVADKRNDRNRAVLNLDMCYRWENHYTATQYQYFLYKLLCM